MKSKRKVRSLFRSFGIYLFVWFIALVLFNIIRRLGTADIVNSIPVNQPGIPIIIQMIVPITVVLAILSVISDKVLSIHRTMYMSYGKVMGLSFIFNMSMLLVTVMAGYRILHRLGLDQIAPNEDVFRAVFSKNMIVAGIYISIMNILFGISRLVNANLGAGNLWKLINGRYHKPREETFIFMFLDLKSSTTAAEKLGHMKYSEMIQACFYDLTIPLQRFRGAVYQYVGDEVVIYWKPDQGLKHANCLRLFFEFDKILKVKEEEYVAKFGWFPEFKAGLHIGPAIVTQVGSVKREIAFHGDTLNAAARIIGLCNEKESKILVSDTLRQQLMTHNSELNQITFHEKGIETLRGKEEKMGVYGVVISP